MTSDALKTWFIAVAKRSDLEPLACVSALVHIELIKRLDAPNSDGPFLNVDNTRCAFARIAVHFSASGSVFSVHPFTIEGNWPDAQYLPWKPDLPSPTLVARAVLMLHVTLTRNVKAGENRVLWFKTIFSDDGFRVERLTERF